MGLSNKKYLVSMIILVLLLGCIGAFVVIRLSPSQGQPSTVDTQLRGGRILILRLPTTTVPLQQVEVFTDGHVDRIPVFLKPSDVAQQAQLKQTEWQRVNSLRNRWCQSPPRFDTLHDDVSFYDVGLRCDDFDYRRIRVPVDMLPNELSTLLESVPHL